MIHVSCDVCGCLACAHFCHVILQIIRKVEKQSVVLDADENISQLHKVTA